MQLARLSDVCYEIDPGQREGMLVPVRVYADEVLLPAIVEGQTLQQLANVATLPGIVETACGMPDMHEGYGFPVGGVAATLLPDGMVSPGGVGFDINCGVRLLATPLEWETGDRRIAAIVAELQRTIPTGVGQGGGIQMDDMALEEVLARGPEYLVEALGLGAEADLDHTESGGRLAGADPAAVSTRAKQRGMNQLGTMGAGNHFVEVQVVDQVMDSRAAAAFGLHAGQVTVLIHTGSRGLGHQVCTDYVALLDRRGPDLGFVPEDRQLACAPASSDEGRAYLAAMACAANYAWANRQALTAAIRRAIKAAARGTRPADISVVYDVAHNIAKPERHGGRDVLVHRKGATRAFGPGSPDLPVEYMEVGQPVLIPGSMGTHSYVMAGSEMPGSATWASACHGAGRRLSRSQARASVTGHDVMADLAARGIVIAGASQKGLVEEAPAAYKDVDQVVSVVERAGIARPVARLRPLGVIKG